MRAAISGPHGHGDAEPGAFPRLRDDAQPPADGVDPVSNADESEATVPALERGHLEADPIGLDPAADDARTAIEADAHGGGLRVLDDIRQRLLNDPEERGLDDGRQPPLERCLDAHGNAGAPPDALREKADGGHEPQVVEDRRAQLVGEAPELRLDLVEHAVDILETLTGGGR